MKLRLFLMPALAGLLFTGLVAAACGGDDDDDDDGNGAEATNTSSSGSAPTATSSGGGTATPAGDDDDDDDDNGGNGGGSVTGSGADDLRRLARDLSGKTFQVTYEFSGSDEELSGGTMTIAQKPPKTATTIENDEGTFIIIDDGQSTYTCSRDESESGCFKLGGSGGIGAGIFSLDTILEDYTGDVDVRRIDDRRIAGRSAQCFEIDSDGEEGIACFDAGEGLMLFAEGESEGETFRMEATEVSTSVSDDVFEPPYEVIG